MKNKISLVAFVDILGFKNLVENYFNGSDKYSLPNLKKALNEAENIGIGYTKQYLKQFKITFSFKQFSDCVSITMQFKQNEHDKLTIIGAFINVVRMYQLILLENNILTRGGVSIGSHFENRNMIFSEGLIKSYKLETDKAIYPRIIIDKEILLLINTISKNDPNQFIQFKQLYGNFLIKDWDEEVFINPFGALNELKSIHDIYGPEMLKSFINLMIEANKLDVQFSDMEMIDLISRAKNEDKKFAKSILKRVNNYLNNSKEKSEVILKYKWLRQFTQWTINSKKSQIKFELYFN